MATTLRPHTFSSRIHTDTDTDPHKHTHSDSRHRPGSITHMTFGFSHYSYRNISTGPIGGNLRSIRRRPRSGTREHLLCPCAQLGTPERTSRYDGRVARRTGHYPHHSSPLPSRQHLRLYSFDCGCCSVAVACQFERAPTHKNCAWDWTHRVGWLCQARHCRLDHGTLPNRLRR